MPSNWQGKDNMKKGEKIVIAGILGFASGVILGTIFTPWSGEEVQKKIGIRKRTVEEKLKKLENKVEKLEETIKKGEKS